MSELQVNDISISTVQFEKFNSWIVGWQQQTLCSEIEESFTFLICLYVFLATSQAAQHIRGGKLHILIMYCTND